VSPTEDEVEKKSWIVSRWSKPVQRVALIAAVLLLLVIAQGASLAFAKPEHTLATPLQDIATTIMDASSEAINLIEDIKRLVAPYERNIISTALHSMRSVEGLSEVPPITIPTNDMTCFPSTEHPLFPEYVDKRFSQFDYTVDSNGIISVHTSDMTGRNLIVKIEQLFDRLTEDK